MVPPTPAEKATLRAQLRQLRAALEPAALERAGDAVAARLLALPEMQAVHAAGVYLAVRKEIPTHAIVRQLVARGVTVAVPRVVAGARMELRAYREPLSKDRLVIPTSDGPAIAHVDVLVCPGLAFDVHGARLGYGGGTFDRWLAEHPATLAIGVCLDEAVLSELPHETHDHPMGAVVTPTRTLRPSAMRVVAAIWIRDGLLLAARRATGRAYAGLWELPGGKVEPGEPDAVALSRELREELGVAATVLPEAVAEAVHSAEDGLVHLVAYEVLSDDAPRREEHDEIRWIAPSEIGALDWAPADRPLLPVVESRVRGSRT
jgi:5,10-methenyltetrahydrofolate synthetase